MSRLSNRQLILTGWWCFVASASFFIIASVLAGDVINLVGSLFFMGANIAFLIPQYRPRHEEIDRRAGEEDHA